MFSCEIKSAKEEKLYAEATQAIENSKWSGEKDWYYHKDGDWYGNYIGWYRYVMTVPSKNKNETILGKDVSSTLVLESYKNNEASKQIKRILYLEVFGNKENINKLTIRFDNGTPYTYTTDTKHNIQVHFSEKDIPEIIENLHQAKTFKIDYTYKTARFNNKNFVKSFKLK